MTLDDLPQADADALLATQKKRESETRYEFPAPGSKLSVPLLSMDEKEAFLLDMERYRIKLTKVKFQNRARQIVVLARIDLNGAPHRNPDGEEIPCPHLHTYREGFGDRWATSLPADRFSDPNDRWQTFLEFLTFCNVIEPPIIDQGLGL